MIAPLDVVSVVFTEKILPEVAEEVTPLLTKERAF
jgi:hypothetical protein